MGEAQKVKAPEKFQSPTSRAGIEREMAKSTRVNHRIRGIHGNEGEGRGC